MQTLDTLTNPDNQPLALTIGNFDGVHLGHQTILQTVVKTADTTLLPAAMTFTPHAKLFFKPMDNFVISADHEKADIIRQCGIKRLYHIPFDTAFSQLPADDFMKALTTTLQVRYLLVGDDFRFGHRGQGGFEDLKKHCTPLGICVEQSPTVRYNEQRISSSLVRQAIKTNDFALVKKLLGRPLSYSGTVVHGQKLGRKLAFPTANLALPDVRLLPNGVFAVKVSIAGNPTAYGGMCNIGHKPTVNQQTTRHIEIHLFDFSGDLYDKMISFTPVKKIRDEQKFTSLAELTAQLQHDKDSTLKILDKVSS